MINSNSNQISTKKTLFGNLILSLFRESVSFPSAAQHEQKAGGGLYDNCVVLERTLHI
jgi:hypothetical protein